MKLHQNLINAVIVILQQVFIDKQYADKVIERVLKQNSRWGGRDRRFIAETAYDMIRWWRLLQEVSGIKEVKKDKDFLQLWGVWMILNDKRLPEWQEFKNLKPYVIEENYKTLSKIRKIRQSIPDWMDELCHAELGKQWEEEIKALNVQAEVVLRTNTLKTKRKELQELLLEQGVESQVLRETPEGIVLDFRRNVFRLPQFKEGFFEVQDASSQQVAHYLRVEPGMRVIDACAGAGGKSLHLAALLQNKGKILALDVEQWKLDELKKRARRAGASNIETKAIDSLKVLKRLEATADRLLLDVPCSGLGVLRRNPDAKWKLSPEFVEQVKTKQKDILTNYSSLLKPGGIMVYSTCSILPSENEKQVQGFLKKQEGAFEFIDERKVLPSQGFDGFYMAAIKRVK
jgi:16S rRNA (cytosine967-C5)-methyltransferase